MYYKYPRTFHLPFSEGITNDDKVLKNLNNFYNKEIVVTLKMDGENTSMYQNKIHARSIDSKDHPSRHWVKQFHSMIKYNIPKNWRICGENLFARHSIFYSDLSSYFLGFSAFDENNYCLSWKKTIELFKKINIIPVDIIYYGLFNENYLKSIDIKNHEGYVIRLADKFHYNEFDKCVAKFVRKNHIQTNQHWMRQEIVKNKILK
jgi:hypothetical protein